MNDTTAMGDAYYFLVNNSLENRRGVDEYGCILDVAVTHHVGTLVVQYMDTAHQMLRDSHVESLAVYSTAGDPPEPCEQTNYYDWQNPWETLSGQIIYAPFRFIDDDLPDEPPQDILPVAMTRVNFAKGVVDAGDDTIVMRVFTFPDTRLRYVTLQDYVADPLPVHPRYMTPCPGRAVPSRPVSPGLTRFIEEGLQHNVLQPMTTLPSSLARPHPFFQ